MSLSSSLHIRIGNRLFAFLSVQTDVVRPWRTRWTPRRAIRTWSASNERK